MTDAKEGPAAAHLRRAVTQFAVADDCRIARKGMPWSDSYENLAPGFAVRALVSGNPDDFPHVWPGTPNHAW